jgi:hypothetical protein
MPKHEQRVGGPIRLSETIGLLAIGIALTVAADTGVAWETRPQTMGEGIPTFVAVAKAADEQHELWIEFASDGQCVPSFTLLASTPFDRKAARTGRAILEPEKGKSIETAADAIGGAFLQLSVPSDAKLPGLLEVLDSAPRAELTVTIGDREVRTTFLLRAGVSSLAATQRACEEALLQQQDGQVFPDSATRPLRRPEVAPISDSLLRLARNEIFARHGRVFESPDLRAHFAKLDWYRPKGDPTVLSEIEKANVALLASVEKARR